MKTFKIMFVVVISLLAVSCLMPVSAHAEDACLTCIGPAPCCTNIEPVPMPMPSIQIPGKDGVYAQLEIVKYTPEHSECPVCNCKPDELRCFCPAMPCWIQLPKAELIVKVVNTTASPVTISPKVVITDKTAPGSGVCEIDENGNQICSEQIGMSPMVQVLSTFVPPSSTTIVATAELIAPVIKHVFQADVTVVPPKLPCTRTETGEEICPEVIGYMAHLAAQTYLPEQDQKPVDVSGLIKDTHQDLVSRVTSVDANVQAEIQQVKDVKGLVKLTKHGVCGLVQKVLGTRSPFMDVCLESNIIIPLPAPEPIIVKAGSTNVATTLTTKVTVVKK
ncbi:MAG: hypothetical protein A3G33_03920 [Omnitrophica bacterium RIFCSPLOWO2_12_FULL_44_17]|uniref:DUF5666 domain-containing protein n=1 Tax=Candidatus Danuiimicrobium aquiferis TaxID=1801832 RepID=A0A1G1KSV0_9BACT|nr:MAG: hypothetical protein A3B72_02180 [Omnitrophica bacterium RIFCSPHIGHO2_02_FULL_45_28]OGW95925.1 MAG: hypothetical protein A3G33_03920 [Omnitrophica bacterium RIFCSPLOWO2_12_FULL_44_17]OGX01924.1 MAG: hypothetical protein A3J12_05335 [Omnitrophica bacterium RIFCSPLOWO2_02_FULL_44_11]